MLAIHSRSIAALAEPTRLAIFRLLVKHEPVGITAGVIAKTIDAPRNTHSSHLATLVRAGQQRSSREGRTIIYRAGRRDMVGRQGYGLERCNGDLEAIKAWSQNLGHNHMLTTLTSYGNVRPERQAEILKRQQAGGGGANACSHAEPDSGTIQTVLALLARSVGHTG